MTHTYLQFLLASGCTPSQLMRTKAKLASMHQQIHSVRAVARGSRLTRKEKRKADFETALLAISNGNLAGLGKLVRTTKEANWRRPDQAWCLLDEAVDAKSSEMVQWLLAMGADPNTLFCADRLISAQHATAPAFYFSPFASAISNGQTAIVQLMLARGASLDLPYCISDEGTATCRDLAIEKGMWPTIEAFLIGQSTGNPAQPVVAKPRRL